MQPISTYPPGGPILLVGAFAVALAMFQPWGLAGAVAAASVAVIVGLRRTSSSVSLAAAAAVGAAMIHFAVAPEHFREWWGFGTFFVVCGEVQLVWALWLRRRPGTAALTIGLGGSVLLVAVWGLSRSVGLPFGPDPGVPESVGTPDVISVLLEVITAVGCAWALRFSGRRLPRESVARALGLVAAGGLTAWALLAIGA
jgi:hypothetical protein